MSPPDHKRKEERMSKEVLTYKEVESRIITLRDTAVLIDRDVAALYGVETRAVNQAVKNNPDKFPKGYLIFPDKQELRILRSKYSTAISPKSRAVPVAFTEKGLYMLATILKSENLLKSSVGAK